MSKKPSWPRPDFCKWLEEFILHNPGNIILGDFNINALDENARHFYAMSVYNQVCEISTHISWSLLDLGYDHLMYIFWRWYKCNIHIIATSALDFKELYKELYNFIQILSNKTNTFTWNDFTFGAVI